MTNRFLFIDSCILYCFNNVIYTNKILKTSENAMFFKEKINLREHAHLLEALALIRRQG